MLAGIKTVSLDVFDTALYRSLLDPDDARLLMDACGVESVEKWACQTRHDIKKFYDYIVGLGLSVVFISDTDYPESLLRELLDREDYHGRIYASSCYGVTKNDGLYNIVLREEKLMPSQLLHVGDNYDSDYRVPREHGIKALYAGRLQDRVKPIVGEYDNRVLFALSHYRALKSIYNSGYWQRLGYIAVGPLLAGFVLWLDMMAKNDDVEKLFFLSSEGQTLKKYYDTIIKEPLPTGYLYVSRRSLALPSFDPDGLDDLDAIDRASLTRLLVAGEDSNENLRVDIPGIIRRERPELMRYLEKSGCLSGFNGFVDIGYGGSMQLAMDRLDKGKRKWYYLESRPEIKNCLERGLDYRAYLDHEKMPLDHYIVFSQSEPTMLLELFLSPDHGTVTGYEDCGPVFYDYPYSEAQRVALKDIREGLYLFAEHNRDFPVSTSIDPASVYMDLYSLFTHPTGYDVKMLRSLTYYLAMGSGGKPGQYKNPIDFLGLTRLKLRKYYNDMRGIA